ncbi:unnamed protein product [Adineta ricciae]|uniref:G domain-containing protein n=1 Tax=Adineta ricciae TaxID=249248 RepID=A0A814BHC5_ADIRI|nr:unnamed protein product [Adineta ricciae]CAF1426109.1 unnamed protein product [Adineta ricciae]
MGASYSNNVASSYEAQFQVHAVVEDLYKQLRKADMQSFLSWQTLNQKMMDILVPMATVTPSRSLAGPSIGIIGRLGTGKSTLINTLLGRNVAKVGVGEVTKQTQSYKAKDFYIYDTPGLDDISTNFTKDNISFWKGLNIRIVVITTSVTELAQILRLFDDIGLSYDLVVNKMDLVESKSQQIFKIYIRDQIRIHRLKCLRNVWFVNALNPAQYPDWQELITYIMPHEKPCENIIEETNSTTSEKASIGDQIRSPFLYFLYDESLCQEDKKYLSNAFLSEQHCFLEIAHFGSFSPITSQASYFITYISSQPPRIPKDTVGKIYYLSSECKQNDSLQCATCVNTVNNLIRRLYHDLAVFYREEAVHIQENEGDHLSVEMLLAKSITCYEMFQLETKRAVI